MTTPKTSKSCQETLEPWILQKKYPKWQLFKRMACSGPSLGLEIRGGWVELRLRLEDGVQSKGRQGWNLVEFQLWSRLWRGWSLGTGSCAWWVAPPFYGLGDVMKITHMQVWLAEKQRDLHAATLSRLHLSDSRNESLPWSPGKGSGVSLTRWHWHWKGCDKEAQDDGKKAPCISATEDRQTWFPAHLQVSPSRV